MDAQFTAAGQLQARQDAQDRGFARPRRAHHRQALAGVEGEIHLVEHQPIPPGHRQPHQLGHRGYRPGSKSCASASSLSRPVQIHGAILTRHPYSLNSYPP